MKRLRKRTLLISDHPLSAAWHMYFLPWLFTAVFEALFEWIPSLSGSLYGTLSGPGHASDVPGRAGRIRGPDRPRRTRPHPWNSQSVTFFSDNHNKQVVSLTTIAFIPYNKKSGHILVKEDGWYYSTWNKHFSWLMKCLMRSNVSFVSPHPTSIVHFLN